MDHLEVCVSAGLPAVANAPRSTFLKGTDWVVAWTRPRCEKTVQARLLDLGADCFLPVFTRRRSYGSVVRISRIPLFAGYVFFNREGINLRQLHVCKKITQILVPDNSLELQTELAQIALAMSKDATLIRSRYKQVGQPVRITAGPMKGLEGELVRVGSQARIVLRIKFLGEAVETQVDEACLETVI